MEENKELKTETTIVDLVEDIAGNGDVERQVVLDYNDITVTALVSIIKIKNKENDEVIFDMEEVFKNTISERLNDFVKGLADKKDNVSTDTDEVAENLNFGSREDNDEVCS